MTVVGGNGEPAAPVELRYAKRFCRASCSTRDTPLTHVEHNI